MNIGNSLMVKNNTNVLKNEQIKKKEVKKIRNKD